MSSRGKTIRQDSGKLSQETKYLVKKRHEMKVSNKAGRIKLSVLSKVINRRKIDDIVQYNMERIERALKDGTSLKSVKRKLGTGRNQIYAVRDKECYVTTKMDEVVNVA